MTIFLFILLHNILPIMLVVVLGFFLGKRFRLDIDTLSKLNFYAFVPCFIFVKVYETALSVEMVRIVVCVALLGAANTAIALALCRLRRYRPSLKNAFLNSITFYNSGNIGIPLITLVFSNPPYVVKGATPYLGAALTTQIVVLIIQNITTNTVGFYNASKSSMTWRRSVLSVLKMPTLYALPAALLCKALPFGLRSLPLWPSVSYINDGLISVALITLGAQLAATKITLRDPDVYLSNFARLILSPCAAVLLLKLTGIGGIYAQTLLIASASPTAVNTALIAVERRNEPEFASQAVMSSTLLCAVTLAGAVFAARALFPL